MSAIRVPLIRRSRALEPKRLRSGGPTVVAEKKETVKEFSKDKGDALREARTRTHEI